MRYHFTKPALYLSMYGRTYHCNHPVYNRCTLYFQDGKGLAVIQQRYDSKTKQTWWTEIDPWLTDAIFAARGFPELFEKRAGEGVLGIYPTITVRQIMWALKLKPLEKQRWETVFDRKDI